MREFELSLLLEGSLPEFLPVQMIYEDDLQIELAFTCGHLSDEGGSKPIKMWLLSPRYINNR